MPAYILVDTTLIDFPEKKPWVKKKRSPSWITGIYDRDAITASPILIDIERAITCNRIDSMLAIVNRIRPQLGVSFIETDLKLSELRDHLRQFIYIKNDHGEDFTLRFSDCIVISELKKNLTREQWSAISIPFKSWKIHGRDGRLRALSLSCAEPIDTMPLILTDKQIIALKSASGTDQLLFNLRRHHSEKYHDYSSIQAYETAKNARNTWLAAGNCDDVNLIKFVLNVFNTNGRLLFQPELMKVLQNNDSDFQNKKLESMVQLIIK